MDYIFLLGFILLTKVTYVSIADQLLLLSHQRDWNIDKWVKRLIYLSITLFYSLSSLKKIDKEELHENESGKEKKKKKG